MNNLAKIESSEIVFEPSLNKAEMQIVKNHASARISEIDHQDIANKLVDSIGEAMVNVGNKNLNQQDIIVLVKQLTEYLKMKKQNCRIDEITQAIKLGSFGEYKEKNQVLYISAPNIIEWINKYQEEKNEVLSKQSKFEEEKKQEEEEKRSKIEGEIKYWKELPVQIAKCKADPKNAMASIYFTNLHFHLGLLHLEEQEKAVIKRIAIEEVRDELTAQRVRINKMNPEILQKKYSKRAKEKGFYNWIEDNRQESIIKMVRNQIQKKGIIEHYENRRVKAEQL